MEKTVTITATQLTDIVNYLQTVPYAYAQPLMPFLLEKVKEINGWEDPKIKEEQKVKEVSELELKEIQEEEKEKVSDR